MRADANAADPGLDLRDHWRIVRRRKWAVLGVLAAALLGTQYYNQTSPVLYESQVVLKFIPHRSPDRMVESVEGVIAAIELDEIVNIAAERLRTAPESLLGAFSVRSLRRSNLISVKAVGRTPEESVQRANALADAHMRWKSERDTRQAKADLEALIWRKRSVEKVLAELEEKKRSFLEKNQTAGRGIQLAGVLLSQESERRELLMKFTPDHPDVMRLDQKIQQTREHLARLPAQELEYERLMRELKASETLRAEIGQAEAEARAVLGGLVLDPDMEVLSRPEFPKAPVYPKKRQNLFLGAMAGLLLGLMLATLLENLDRTLTRVDQIESFIGVPVLGVVPHFTPGRSRCIFSISDGGEAPEGVPVCLQNCRPCRADMYHPIRAAIEACLGKPGPKVLIFTSAQMGEGKTVTAVNFCLSAAQAGLKVLLIDADLRRPSVHGLLGLGRDPGIVDVLAERRPWKDAIRGATDLLLGAMEPERIAAFPGIENFKVMTAWANKAHIVDVLSSPRLPALLKELRGRFDLTVIDCTPLLLFVDALLPAAHADGVILVYRAGRTPRGLLMRAKQMIVEAKRVPIGIILNDQKASQDEDHGYYEKDYDHYSREPKGAPRAA
jgi:capsular exopolysaccharide synthesis family protein